MQIGDNLHEMSEPIFLKKKKIEEKKKSKCCLLNFLPTMLSINKGHMSVSILMQNFSHLNVSFEILHFSY